MIRLALRILLFGLLAVILIAVYEKVKGWTPWGKAELKSSHNLVLEKVSSLGKLELVKYTFKDIVEQEIVQQLLPNPKALLIIQGEAVGCVDFTKINESNIKTTKDTLTLSLPTPEICYSKIDHQKSKIYDTQYAFMNEALLLEEAYKTAEKQIMQNAIDNGIYAQTEKNARLLLEPLLKTISQKPVKINFDLKEK